MNITEVLFVFHWELLYEIGLNFVTFAHQSFYQLIDIRQMWLYFTTHDVECVFHNALQVLLEEHSNSVDWDLVETTSKITLIGLYTVIPAKPLHNHDIFSVHFFFQFQYILIILLHGDLRQTKDICIYIYLYHLKQNKL